MRFVHSDDNSRQIRRVLAEPGPKHCAVAFIGYRATELLPAKGAPVRVICNLASGGTNPRAVAALLKRANTEVRTIPALHAKVYISPGIAVVGSANLSANGLGLEDEELEGWEEAGVVCMDPIQIRRMLEWFEGAWRRAEVITPSLLEVAARRWDEQRTTRPKALGARKPSNSLLEALRKDDPIFRDRRVFFVIATEKISEDADAELGELQAQSEYGEGVDVYEDWPGLPLDAWLIGILVSGRTVRFQGIYKTPEREIVLRSEPMSDRGDLYLCFKDETLFGMRMTQAELQPYARNVRRLLELPIGDGDAGSKVVPAVVARSLLFQKKGSSS